MDPDDREFMRELLLRHEKATNSMITRHEKATVSMIERLDANTEALRTHTQALRTHMREFVAEMQAQRQALFRILDRLDGQGA